MTVNNIQHVNTTFIFCSFYTIVIALRQEDVRDQNENFHPDNWLIGVIVQLMLNGNDGPCRS